MRLATLVLLLGAMATAVRAEGDDPTVQAEILRRLAALEQRVGGGLGLPSLPPNASQAAILDRIAAIERAVAAGPAPAPVAADPGTGPAASPSLDERFAAFGLGVRGSLDVAYNYNLKQPNSQINKLRAFDVDAGEFNIHLLDLIIEHVADEPGTWGFRADLTAGEDCAIFQSAGWADGDNFELEQAYAEYVAPVGSGLRLTLGKFVTAHGAEVIESADNMNTSRSLLFTWAIPFTHTGFKAAYDPCDEVNICLGIVNGWDNVDDGNKSKSFHGMVKVTPNEIWNVAVSGTYGPEQVGDNGDKRGLVDVVLTVTPCDKWTFVLNGDFATEEGAGIDAGDTEWYGVAAYAKYQFAEEWYLCARGEWFRDVDGARLGLSGQTMWEQTFTLSWRPIDAAEVRIEARHDESNRDVFDNEMPLDSDDQDTLSFEVIYRF